MIPGTSYNPWEIWAAVVKYEDSPQVKKRPVLVLENKVVYAVCLKMTSAQPRAGEYALKEWAQAGLRKQTTVRLGKILHMTSRDFLYKIGDLSPFDIINMQTLLTEK